jgi:hypothetical protein
MNDGDQKKLLNAPLVGEQGVALAKLLTLEMGSAWHEMNPLLETGIDAAIELRDPTTGVMLNRWLHAQSKAHNGPFKAETSDSFIFMCRRRDLRYWTEGNTPVILIVSRPVDRDAWWQPISPALLTGNESANVEIVFNKKLQKYGSHSYGALLQLTSKQPKGSIPTDPWSDETVARFQPMPSRIEIPFSSLGTAALVPAVPLGLTLTDGQTVNVRAIIDTSAENSCFPFEWAEMLGIELNRDCIEMVTVTVGGSSTTYLAREPVASTVFGVNVPLKAIFAPTPAVLLGRTDFLAHFIVTVDARNNTFSLKPVP